MGYTTDFTGAFYLDKPLADAHFNYLKKFNESRRMKRNAKKAEKLDDPIRIAAGLPIGVEGEYFVGAKGCMGQDEDSSVTDGNYPPSTQPGLWCQWTPNEEETTEIQWDCGEKFYNYVEWLQYIIDNFLKRWDYVLNGEVEWQGEDSSDMGKIVVTDNEIKVLEGRVVYE